MQKEYILQTPLGSADVAALKLGDMVYLSGAIVTTAGLPTHQRLVQFIERGEKPPIDMEQAAFLHLGNYTREQNGKFEILYTNPTTSGRFNPYMPAIIRAYKLRAVGGKGGLDAKSVQAMQETGCVYLSFLGAGCPLLSSAIRDVIAVAWSDLVMHYRLTHLTVERLGPAVVAIDAHGNSLYENISAELEKKMAAMMKNL
jgi:fumarate hydratase subunit beta